MSSKVFMDVNDVKRTPDLSLYFLCHTPSICLSFVNFPENLPRDLTLRLRYSKSGPGGGERVVHLVPPSFVNDPGKYVLRENMYNSMIKCVKSLSPG